MVQNEDELCAECACRDMAIELPEGLSDIEDLQLAKRLVFQIAARLSMDQLLVRISNSQFPVELLRFLPHVYGVMKDQLKPVAELLLEKGKTYFDSDALGEFANLYWQAIVNERIVRKDFRRAFDEMKRSFRGMRIDPEAYPEDALTNPPKNGLAEDMAASPECVRQMVHKLHTAMHDAGVMDDVLLSSVAANYRHSDPGYLFAMAVDGCERAPFNPRNLKISGFMVLAIARYLSDERSKSRKRHVATQVELQS